MKNRVLLVLRFKKPEFFSRLQNVNLSEKEKLGQDLTPHHIIYGDIYVMSHI